MLKITHKSNTEYFRKHNKLNYIFEDIRIIRNRSAVASKGSNRSTIHSYKSLPYNRYKYYASKLYNLKRVSRFGNQAAYLIFHSYNTMYEVPPIDDLHESNIISFGELARRRK